MGQFEIELSNPEEIRDKDEQIIGLLYVADDSSARHWACGIAWGPCCRGSETLLVRLTTVG